MSRRFTSIVLSLLLAPSLSVAQVLDPLFIGQRVRVVSRCQMGPAPAPQCPGSGVPSPYEWTYSGQVVALNADTMRIRGASSEAAFAIPTASIVRLSVVNGTRGHFWKGAGIGRLGGAFIGGASGSTTEFCSWLEVERRPAL